MPLIATGVTTEPKDKNELWTNKLVGKKLHDDVTDEINFCKKDLPEETRIISPGSIVTRDFKENRLNVHLAEDGTVSHVIHG